MLFFSTTEAKSDLPVRLKSETSKILCSCSFEAFSVEIGLNKFRQELKYTSFNIYLVIVTINQRKVWIYQHLKILPRWVLKRCMRFLVQPEGSQHDAEVSEWEWNSSVYVIVRSMIRVVPRGCNMRYIWYTIMSTFLHWPGETRDLREYITHAFWRRNSVWKKPHNKTNPNRLIWK